MPDGQTVYEKARDQVALAYDKGVNVLLLGEKLKMTDLALQVPAEEADLLPPEGLTLAFGRSSNGGLVLGIGAVVVDMTEDDVLWLWDKLGREVGSGYFRTPKGRPT